MTAQEHIGALEIVIATKTGVTVDELHSRRRDAQITHARGLVWALAYDYLNYTFKEIGRVYGRDHTTIVNGYYRIKKLVNIKTVAEEIRTEVPGVLERKTTPYEPIRKK